MLVELLIKHNANMNMQNGEGKTSLHVTICWDLPDVAKLSPNTVPTSTRRTLNGKPP